TEGHPTEGKARAASCSSAVPALRVVVGPRRRVLADLSAWVIPSLRYGEKDRGACAVASEASSGGGTHYSSPIVETRREPVMKRFPVRYRVQTVMLAVAAVGLVLGALSCAARLRARAERFRAIASDHYFAKLPLPGSDRGELDIEPLRA